MLEYLELDNVGPAPRMEAEFAAAREHHYRGQRPRKELSPRYRVVGADGRLAGGRQSTHDLRPAGPTPQQGARGEDTLAYAPTATEPSSQVCATPGPKRLGRPKEGRLPQPSSCTRTPTAPSRSGTWLVTVHRVGPARSVPSDGLRTCSRESRYGMVSRSPWMGDRFRCVTDCSMTGHTWMKAKDAKSTAMAQALHALSPDWDGGDRLEPGPPMRLSIDDAAGHPIHPDKPCRRRAHPSRVIRDSSGGRARLHADVGLERASDCGGSARRGGRSPSHHALR